MMVRSAHDSAILRSCLGAVLGSLAVGAGWSWIYGLEGGSSAALAAVHAVSGLVLGWLLAISRRSARGGVAVGLVASLALAGLAPLSIGWFTPSTGQTASARELARTEPRDAPTRRIALIGLDGGDWSVIDPLIAAGELPHLAGLLARGRGAVLRSIEPIASPVVWTSIFTGRPPEQHGIVGWTQAHAANRRTGVLWEMAGAAGLASLVVNVPGTWPPTSVDGALISGFPMPGALRRVGQDPRLAQNVGIVVSEREHDGPLHYARAVPTANGGLRAQAYLGGWLAPTAKWRHFAVDAAIRRGWLPIARVEVPLERAGDGAAPASWSVGGEKVALAPGAWSPWIATRAPASPLFVRIRRVADGGLFLTPAFQDPRAPIHAFASSREVQERVAELGMYVVEPAGWKSAADPIAREAIFEHLVDVEEMHLRASLALREWRTDWRVLAHVITLPDRVSHAFWRFHRAEDYPPISAEELAAHRDKVVRAYRESDRLLGRLLEGLGPDTTVIVLSDHGFTSHGDSWGEHRLDGMLVAAGPGIAAGPERISLSVYDVVPASLALLGLPVADDLAAGPPTALLAPGTPVARIASYETITTTAPSTATSIDQTTEEQLRGLGYVE
jgi:predicted AlkP superfamily phosphohydrolase/phosphomutase